jgi:hypothetical protein
VICITAIIEAKCHTGNAMEGPDQRIKISAWQMDSAKMDISKSSMPKVNFSAPSANDESRRKRLVIDFYPPNKIWQGDALCELTVIEEPLHECGPGERIGYKCQKILIYEMQPRLDYLGCTSLIVEGKNYPITLPYALAF